MLLSVGRAGRRLLVDKFEDGARKLRRLRLQNEVMRRALEPGANWHAESGRA
jgi:hypothetical protein